MRSPKHRTTSKSGGSRKSTSKPARSRENASTSRTPPASFESVFGKEESPQTVQYRELLAKSDARLRQLLQEPVPANGLLRTRHKQRIAREKRLQRDLEELIAD